MSEPVAATAAGVASETPWWKTTLAGVVTIVALGAFFVGVAYLFLHLNDQEPAWSRSVYLLSGIEAVTFAAVGWLFGKEVHRAQAEAAEKRADSADSKREKALREATDAAKEAATERSKGQTMAAAAQSLQSATQEDMQLRPKGSQPGAEPDLDSTGGAAVGLRSLADLAAKLYPEIRS